MVRLRHQPRDRVQRPVVIAQVLPDGPHVAVGHRDLQRHIHASVRGRSGNQVDRVQKRLFCRSLEQIRLSGGDRGPAGLDSAVSEHKGGRLVDRAEDGPYLQVDQAAEDSQVHPRPDRDPDQGTSLAGQHRRPAASLPVHLDRSRHADVVRGHLQRQLRLLGQLRDVRHRIPADVPLVHWRSLERRYAGSLHAQTAACHFRLQSRSGLAGLCRQQLDHSRLWTSGQGLRFFSIIFH